MKHLIIILLLIASINLNAQQNREIIQYTLKLDSTYLFIDNSNRNWYTLEFNTDTLFSVESNIFFGNGKTIQINSIPFRTAKNTGVKGSSIAEKKALIHHKKWELNYQKNLIRKNLKSKKDIYYDKRGKPFLIWSFKNPKRSNLPVREIEIITNKHSDEDTVCSEFGVTHQLFLDFIVHGNIIISISTPVLETETLNIEKGKLIQLANSLNVYGNYIDLDILHERINNKKDNFVIKDEQNLLEIQVPSWLNICKSPYKDVYSFSFPEKDNITNGIAVLCEKKSDSISFNDFRNKLLAKNTDDNSLKLISSENNKEIYFFTKNNSWFYGQNIFIESEKSYCFINFISTKTTYDLNVEKFYDFINGIELK